MPVTRHGAHPIHRTRETRSGLTIALIGLLAAACATGGTTASASPPPSAAPSAPPAASIAVPASPAPTVAPATVVPSSNPSAVSAVPPVAALAVEGGDPVAGELGSYSWNGGGSDSPWLPGSAITGGTGERLSVSVEPDVGIASWVARRVAAGTSDGAGAIGVGDGTGPVSFAAPEKGHWSIQLTLGFADDLGSAVYYWDLTVR